STGGATKSRGLVSNRWIALHTSKNADRRRLILPARAPDHFLCACVWTFRILFRALLIVSGIVPVIDPFPNIAGHVIQAKGALARLITSDGHERLVADPLLIVIEMFGGRLDIPPRESPIRRPFGRFLPFGFSGESFVGPSAIGLCIKPINIDNRSIDQHLGDTLSLPEVSCRISWVLWNSMPCGLHEFQITTVCHFKFVDHKCVDEHIMTWIFIASPVTGSSRHTHREQ